MLVGRLGFELSVAVASPCQLPIFAPSLLWRAIEGNTYGNYCRRSVLVAVLSPSFGLCGGGMGFVAKGDGRGDGFGGDGVCAGGHTGEVRDV